MKKTLNENEIKSVIEDIKNEKIRWNKCNCTF